MNSKTWKWKPNGKEKSHNRAYRLLHLMQINWNHEDMNAHVFVVFGLKLMSTKSPLVSDRR